MKQYIYGSIVGILITAAAFWAFTAIQSTKDESPASMAWDKILGDYTNPSNHVRGSSSAKSPDEKWTAWVSDEYSEPENKNYVSFVIYGTNGYEQTYTRFECFGGIARGSTISWSPNGSTVNASIPMITNWGPIRGSVEIEYNFPEDRLITERIPE